MVMDGFEVHSSSPQTSIYGSVVVVAVALAFDVS